MSAVVEPDNLSPSERNKHYQQRSIQQEQLLRQLTADITSNVGELLKPTHAEYLKKNIMRIGDTANLVCKDDKLNFVCLHSIIECTVQLCQEAAQLVKAVKLQVQGLKADSDEWDEAMCLFKKNIAIVVGKIVQLEEFILYAKNTPLDDLWCQSSSSQLWQKLRMFTRYCEFERVEKSINDYNKKGEIVYFLLAAMGRGAHLIPETNQEADNFLDGAWTDKPQLPIVIKKSKPVDIEKLDDFDSKLVPRLVHYMMNKEKGLTDGSFFVANPEPQIIRLLFNFKDKRAMKFLANIQSEITDTDTETDVKHYLSPNMFQDFLKRPSHNELLSPFRLIAPAGGKIELSKHHLLHGGLCSTPKSQTLRVRLLYYREFKNFHRSLKEEISSLVNTLQEYPGPHVFCQAPGAYLDPKSAPPAKVASSKVVFTANYEPSAHNYLTEEEKRDFERVFVHVHGGGFVAQSSTTHKGYLNPWANNFKRPIFSIDYRLADKTVHFPEPVNDVITGYIWILNYMEFVLKVVPKQIIFIGDSAGAALITLLTAWCISNGVRRPDCVMMFYPAINSSPAQYTPSLLNSLDDRFLNYSALTMCGLYYAHEAASPWDNPYINLNKMSSEVLSKFPPTEIFVGDRDPLRDDAGRFALKLFNLQVKIKLNIMKGLSHAQLSNSGTSGTDGANGFVGEILKSLAKVLSVPLTS
jgi:acetyl esterase/lipase